MDYTIDCTNKKVGRIATQIAHILQGKNKATYEPRLEGEDRVIIKNVELVELSGAKESDKKYYSHTTQIGHLHERKVKDVVAKHGKSYIVKHAVLRMLPKNKLQIKRIKRLIFEK